MTRTQPNKPIIETIINSIALTLTSYGVVQITNNVNYVMAYTAVIFGVALEFIKYYGRKHKFW